MVNELNLRKSLVFNMNDHELNIQFNDNYMGIHGHYMLKEKYSNTSRPHNQMCHQRYGEHGEQGGGEGDFGHQRGVTAVD